MTPIKCPGCGSLNNSADTKCSGCGSVLRPQISPAIQKPAKPLPESSFADLAEPDYGGVFPSHSRTPQMMARMAAAKQTSNHTENHREDTSQSRNPPLKINDLSPTPTRAAANVPKIDSANDFRQIAPNPVAVPKAKNNLLMILIVVGIAGLLAGIAGIGLLFFLMR